jgi:hypothetical protein
LKPDNARNHTGNRQKFGEMLFREDCSIQNCLAIGRAPQVGVHGAQEANGAGDRRSHGESIFIYLQLLPTFFASSDFRWSSNNFVWKETGGTTDAIRGKEPGEMSLASGDCAK